MFGIVKSVFGRAGVYARALLTVVVALVALAAPSAAFALSAGCSAINALGGTFTVDGAGNGTDKFTDFASQPLANGEVVTYSWSGNTKGAYVYILYSQNSGFQFALNPSRIRPRSAGRDPSPSRTSLPVTSSKSA